MKLIDKVFPEVTPDYLSRGVKVPYKLRRFDRGDDRYYHIISRNKIKESYISITSLCSKVLPITEGLKRYIGNMGYEGSQKDMAIRAARGSLYHIESMRPILKKGYSFTKLETTFKESLPYWARDYADEWLEEFKRDLMCWFLFLKERVRKIYAVETPLRCKKWGYATTIDMRAEVKFGRRYVDSIVDLKSGKKGFFEPHVLQLHGCREAWNENFPNLKATHIFNFAPVDYRKSVTYKLENQTEKMIGEFDGIPEWEYWFRLAKARGIIKPPSKYDVVWGEFDDISKFDPENHSFTYSLK